MNEDGVKVVGTKKAEGETIKPQVKPIVIEPVNWEKVANQYKVALRDLVADCEKAQSTIEGFSKDLASGKPRTGLSSQAMEVSHSIGIVLDKARKAIKE